MSDVDLIPEEASAWAAIHRLGLSIGCDHVYGVDGIHATERCLESSLICNNQRFEFQLWGSPWFGCGKLTLQFNDTGDTYTYWAVFLGRKLSLAIHFGGRQKGDGQ